MAPQVIKMQVSHAEVNTVLDTLESFLTHAKNPHDKLEFSEAEAFQILENSVPSDTKAKTILTSLCHWRRLLMHRDENEGMLFAVNQFSE